VVSQQDDGDITIGFAGFEWHTHGDLLASSYQLVDGIELTPEGAAMRFVEDVVSNHAVIAVVKSGNRIRDIWVTDDMDQELQYKQPDEEVEFRYWDGTNARQSAG
jgi:hypothetical protein